MVYSARMNKPKTFIFTGRSGSGKGTQLKLLQDYLKTIDPQTPQFASVTGDLFREFFNKDVYASARSKEITEEGKLQPLFLVIGLWANDLIENCRPDAHLFIDGYPRREEEAPVVDSMIQFFNREDVVILHFDVSREVSRERMLSRHREDDTVATVDTRLDWYDKHVIPAIDYFRGKEDYRFIEIDGTQPIEVVHEQVKEALGYE